MDPALVDLLRDDLQRAGYRIGSVSALLGPVADRARQRGVFAPARRALAEGEPSPLARLVRAFLLAEETTGDALDGALPSIGAAGAAELGLVAETSPGLYRAALSLNPVRIDDARLPEPLEWWILSDLDDQLRRGPARADHVMGVGGATRSLIAQLPPHDAARSLDLGTGCGIVALHLALRGEVVATDISGRALGLARANARLNGMTGRIDFRRGDLFEPVAGEAFDLIASNPPFVITPRGDASDPVYAYRDGGRTGDELPAAVVRTAPAHLERGGTFICLANWESLWGRGGLDRVRGWIDDAAAAAGPLAGWVIERDRVDPVQYAETWARDGGARPGDPEFERLVAGWLDDFAMRRVVAVGLGSVRIARPISDAGDPAAPAEPLIRVEHADGAYAAGGALGAELASAFAAGVAAARMSDDEVLATRWVLDETVGEVREHRPGEEAPRAIALVTERPVARRVVADTLLAAAVGACDGELALGQIADALAGLLEVDAAAVEEALVTSARELAWLGMLAQAGAAHR